MKTRSYLIAMVAAILAPTIFLLVLGLQQLLHREKEARLLALDEKVHSITLTIDQEIADVEGGLRLLANTNYVQQGDLAALYELMKKGMHDTDSWGAIYDHEGHIVVTTTHPFGHEFPGIIFDWVPEAIRSGKVTVSNLRQNWQRDLQVVSVNIPVTTANGRQFLLSRVFNASHFTKSLQTKGISETWVVGLFGADGITIVRCVFR